MYKVRILRGRVRSATCGANFAFSQVVLIGQSSAQFSCALMVLKKWVKEK